MADKESPEEIETLKTKGTHEGIDRKGDMYKWRQYSGGGLANFWR